MSNLGLKNNNPGNLRDPSTGAFRVFNTPEEGQQALIGDLKIKQSGQSAHIKQGASIAQLGDVWAPPSDNNVKGDWARNVASALGVNTAYAFDKLPAEQLAKGIQVAEGTSTMPINQNLTNMPTPTSGVSGSNALVQKMRAKYPQYNDISDDELTQKILQKYPQYGDLAKQSVDSNSGPASEQPQTQFKPTYEAKDETIPPVDASNLSFGQQMSSRANYAAQGLSDAAHGKINPLSGLLHVAGAAGGAVGDIAGDVVGAITPDFIKKPVMSAIGGAVNAVANTGLGKSVVSGAQGFSQAHPELSADIGDVGNIAMAVPIVRGVGLAKNAVGGVIGKALGKDALSETMDAISPEIKAGTKAGATNVGQRGTTESFFSGKINRVEDPILRETAPIIQQNIPKFDQMKTYAKKLNAIQDEAIPREAQALRDALTKEEIQPILHKGSYEKFVNDIEEQIKSSPFLIGDSGEYARRFLKIFNDKLPIGRDITMIDVLDARQALDRAAKSFKPKVFDGASENAFHSGLDAVRSSANTLLDENAPNAGVKASLRRQSLLYKAAKNLSSKADKEVGSTRFGRFTGRHPKITGLIKTTGKLAAEGAGFGAVVGGANALLNKN